MFVWRVSDAWNTGKKPLTNAKSCRVIATIAYHSSSALKCLLNTILATPPLATVNLGHITTVITSFVAQQSKPTIKCFINASCAPILKQETGFTRCPFQMQSPLPPRVNPSHLLVKSGHQKRRNQYPTLV
eukprot:32484_1